jgi:phage terminase large subunit
VSSSATASSIYWAKAQGSNAWGVRVLGEFPTAEDETVIPLELVVSAVGRTVSSLDYYPVWGVDVARFGDDRTALAKRQANKLLEPIRWWHSTDLMATGGTKSGIRWHPL